VARRWTDLDFLERAHAWIRDHAEVTGPIEQTHVRIWSTVMRVPTADGILWFKAPDNPSEIGLTILLDELRPGWVPEVTASDDALGWMLLRDAGTRLRELLEADPDLSRWEVVLAGCADLQLATAPHTGRLLDLGTSDLRLAGLTARVAALLDEDEFLVLDGPEGLTRADRERLRARLPEIEGMCAELAAAGIPETVQHDDLNDGNVFVDGDRYRITDWGDACISHPFHTLTVALRAIAWKLGLEPGGRDIVRLRDAYLEPFGTFGTHDELVRLSEIGYRTGTLGRALAWRHDADRRSPEDRFDDVEAVPYGLNLFLAGGPIGTWE
jgi:hypothetical protein